MSADTANRDEKNAAAAVKKRTPSPAQKRPVFVNPVCNGRLKRDIEVYYGDNLTVLQQLPAACISLIYIDPPFNTGKVQARTQISTVQDEAGDRTGYQGKRYKTIKRDTKAYADKFADYESFLRPRLIEAKRILRADGSLFFHIDYRESHYCKILLDDIFGRHCFMNEIIWAYDYGARSRKKWSSKHDTIFWYAQAPENYIFNYEAIDRIPYIAPGLVGKEKAARGKTPTDVWWHTIVSPGGKEKTGYPTQKPRGIIDRIVRVHSNPGDIICDFFAGSGTLGESAVQHNRQCILMDKNPEALTVMQKRFRDFAVQWHK